MSQFDKLIQRILKLPRDVRFEELQKVLEHFGYTMSKSGSGGSHRTFRKEGCPPITIPQSPPIKLVSVIVVKNVIEKEMSKDENGR